MTSTIFILNEALYGSERCTVLRLEIPKQRAKEAEKKHE